MLAPLKVMALDNVAVYCKTGDFAALKPDLVAYKKDVERRFPVRLIMRTGDWKTPEELRKSIRRDIQRARISGAVLVGALPMHHFYIHEEVRPNVLYYEDPYQRYQSVGNHGADDRRIGASRMRIWVTNIRASAEEADPDLEGLRTFFKKTRAYYRGDQRIDFRAFAVSGRDWPEDSAFFMEQATRNVFRNAGDVVTEVSKVNVQKLMNEHTYRIAYVRLHSDWTCHGMEAGEEENLYADEIAQFTGGALFVVVNGCSVVNWFASNAEQVHKQNTALSWVFGKGIGQAAVGNVRVGNFYEWEALMDRVFAGDYLGRAYMAAKQRAETGFTKEFPDGSIISGNTLVGNPFLYPLKRGKPSSTR